jgi:hypothetical protein
MRAEPVFGQVEQRHGQPVASSFVQPGRRELNLRNGDLSIGAPDEPSDESANPREPASSWTHGIRVQITSLARGVDPTTVQAWMGHASISTTNLYLHRLGTSTDRAGLDRPNARDEGA